MEIIKTLCWIVQIISALSIIVLVLLQHGKGADAGATFGSGSSGSLFGATGSTSFLSRITAIFAVIFFSTTFGLVLLSANLGVGGGFLIIPALLFLAKTPMKMAVGTSLFIVSVQSLIGFMGDIRPEQNINWNLLFIFTACSIIGVFIGSYLSRKIAGEQLKTSFGWFVLIMGIYIIVKETLLK